MTIFTDLVISGVSFNQNKGIGINAQANQRFCTKQFEAKFDNPDGRHNTDFGVGDNVSINVSVYPHSTLTSWWKFDDLTGSISSDSFGTNNGSINDATFINGLIGSAFQFSGVDSRFTVPFNKNLELNTGGTIELRFFTTEDDGDIIENNSSTNDGWRIRIRNTNNIRKDLDLKTFNNFLLTQSNAYQLNKWHHLVAVLGNSDRRMYIDGALVGSDTVNALPTNTGSADLSIGNGGSTAVLPDSYVGNIDNVKIYNRPFTDAEVKQLFDGKVFKGKIDDIDFKGKEKREQVILRGRDFTSLMQDISVQPVVFNNLKAGSIVRKIMADEFPSITTSGVDIVNTKNITHIRFFQKSVLASLKELADLSNAYFCVDEKQDLTFIPVGSKSSGEIFDETNVREAKVIETEDSMINSIFVYGDRQLHGLKETFTGDGVGSVFTLNNRPHNTEVDVAGTTKRGGIFELNFVAFSGVQYLVDFDQKKIIFVSGTEIGYSEIPANSAAITVNYDRETPIVKFAENQDSITAYGKKRKIIVDKNIDDPITARDIALNQIELNKDPATEINLFLNRISPLNPGDTAIVNLPNNDISGTFNIISTQYNFTPDRMFSDNTLNVKLDNHKRDVIDILANLNERLVQLEAADIDETDLISRLESFTGSLGLRIKEWKVQSRGIGSSFILGHSVNGLLGAGQTPVTGTQIVLGDGRAGLVIEVSGT